MVQLATLGPQILLITLGQAREYQGCNLDKLGNQTPMP